MGTMGRAQHETIRAGTWTTGQLKLRVTICLRKETDTKKLSIGGWQDQAPVGGPWVCGCRPSQDGCFVGSEPILSKSKHCCPTVRVSSPFRHLQSHHLCTFVPLLALCRQGTAAQPVCWGPVRTTAAEEGSGHRQGSCLSWEPKGKPFTH